MRAYDNGSFYTVSVSYLDIAAFADTWPCSGMRNPKVPLAFTFDKRNGDLVDMVGESEEYDQSALLALSQDAQAYGRKHLKIAP